MDLQLDLKNKIQMVDLALKDYFPLNTSPSSIVTEAMRYSIFAGGKRLRPILILAGCQFTDGEIELAMPFACAMEMIHTYSLIHDDLPAMDNDDYRRGKLTNHKVYGDAIAILAGDGLLNLAFETMIKAALSDPPNLEKKVKAMNEIAISSGIKGMIGGQVADILNENKRIDEKTLYYIHHNKTAALIIASIRAGAVLGNCNEEMLRDLTNYASNIGYGFQITDDILDIVGDEAKLGKKTGSDIENQKSTYPSLFGLEESYKKVDILFENAVNSIAKYGNKAEFLIDLAQYLVKRNY